MFPEETVFINCVPWGNCVH